MSIILFNKALGTKLLNLSKCQEPSLMTSEALTFQSILKLSISWSTTRDPFSHLSSPKGREFPFPILQERPPFKRFRPLIIVLHWQELATILKLKSDLETVKWYLSQRTLVHKLFESWKSLQASFIIKALILKPPLLLCLQIVS